MIARYIFMVSFKFSWFTGLLKILNQYWLQRRDSWKSILLLAYQSLGVVYGDLSISPLYVYKSTFAEDITHSETNEEIFGVLSFVFWTLTLVPLFKYVFIVLRADDNGEGRYQNPFFLLFSFSDEFSLTFTFVVYVMQGVHLLCILRYAGMPT